MRSVVISLLMLIMLAGTAASAPTQLQLPRYQNVHGYGNPDVKQSNLSTTVCQAGYSSSIRPSTSYTNYIKGKLLHYYKLPGTISDYELDHEISISLGGSVYDTRNLWMQPWSQAKPDDTLELRWWRQLCTGTITLKQARQTELAHKREAG
jgi:hypothetical protein